MSDDSPILDNILLFTRMLYRAGLPISTSQTIAFCEALCLVDMSIRSEVYYAARGLLVTRQEHIALFDTIFGLFWRKISSGKTGQGQRAPLAPRHNRPQQHEYSLAMLMARRAQKADKEIELADKSGSFSAAELLQRKEFAMMTAEELQQVKQLIQEMRWSVSLRKTRRWVPDRHGQKLHLRRMMRSAVKMGGTPIEIARLDKKIKERPIVLLADISGSMEKYARLILQFFYSVSHSLKLVETFAFGTRLTRLTPTLKLRNIDRAIRDASREVIDWSGGTRIGESFKTFNQQWSRRVLRRGAIVIIVSDGWERGDAGTIQREMRYLQHRCHRLIWLNPLAGRTSYQPRVEGMSAALPYIDDFLPIHNLQSLQALADHLAALD